MNPDSYTHTPAASIGKGWFRTHPKTLWLSGFLLLLCFASFYYWLRIIDSAQWHGPPPVDLEIAALIDQLVQVDGVGVGYHPTAHTGAFLAIDEKPPFRGGVIGSAEPKVSQAMRELVRRGTASLPDLLIHLSDSRKTKVVIGGGIVMNLWFSPMYDARHWQPGQQPNLNDAETLDFMDSGDTIRSSYTLRVGDLCYVAIGQIVNRSLNATVYIPSGNCAISSPVAIPRLAQAVRGDWADLTPEMHKKSLLQDAAYPYGEENSLKRLIFYYPDEGQRLASLLLDRPIYDEEIATTIATRLLDNKDGPKSMRADLDDSRIRSGAVNSLGVLAFLLFLHNHESRMNDEELWKARKSNLPVVLKELWPEITPSAPPVSSVATISMQIDLLASLAGFPSKGNDSAIDKHVGNWLLESQKNGREADLLTALHPFRSENIDRAVEDCFRAFDFKQRQGFDRIYNDDFVIACIERFDGKRLKAELQSYCNERLEELHQNENLQWAELQRKDTLNAKLAQLNK